MKTDDLISMLARDVDAVETHALQRRYAIAMGCGAFGALLLMAITLGVRPDLAEAALLSVPMLGALLWAMRGLAPTRLALAGAAAGLLSGAGGPCLCAALHGNGCTVHRHLVPGRHADSRSGWRVARPAAAAVVVTLIAEQALAGFVHEAIR